MNCIFCEIVKGNIPCYKIYEDEKTLAFLDISKEGYGHTLVVPKKHADKFCDADSETISCCMKTAKKICKHYIENCGFTGANIIINNGESAGQSVQHLHIHIIPRKIDDGVLEINTKKYEEDLESVQKHLTIKEDESEKINVSGKKVILYTDGACSGNPGMGGYCAILKCGEHEKIISGGDRETTNNRMELLGVIKGLEALIEPCDVDVYSDSAYVVNAFLEDWLTSWVMNNWKTKGNKEVANVELWQRLLELTKIHDVTWHKVKGHSDNELNNRCDEIARGEIEKLKNE